MNRSSFCALAMAVACAGTLQAQKPASPAPKPSAPAQTAAPKQPAVAPATTRPKWVEPLKGTAVLEVLKPVVKVQGKEVVTTLKVKNASYGPIAGLRVDEYWYDKSGSVIGGDSKRMKQLVQPNEIVTFELRTPRDPKMNSNSYQFTHANGKVRTDVVKKIE